ncbi:alpha-2-macroglobulin family protein [Flavitalea antarctica]
MKTSFFLFLGLCFSFCLSNNFLNPVQAQTPMKTYSAEWRKIDTLVVGQGLTKSALTAVNNIYNAALKEGNETQVLKALVYQVMLEENVTEDGQVNGIRKLERNLAIVKEPARSVLNNIIAEKYWRYFQQNRWKFYDRTATTGYVKENPDTWAPEDFHSAISKYYLASLNNEEQLQSSALKPFDPIITSGNMRKLRPTLYDLLAHRALQYFRNDERTVTKPSYSFEIRNDTSFAPAEIFTRASFLTADTISPYYQAIRLYQKLIRFHLNDKTKDALLDVDISRLAFMKEHAVVGNKLALYEKALQHITDTYGDLPAASQAWYLQAALHADNARTYAPLVYEAHRYEWIKAREICERLVAAKDSSEGKMNALNLLQEINEKSIELQLEKVNVPGQPFRARVSFRNFTRLHFRLVKIDAGFNTTMNETDEEDSYWKRLLAQPLVKTFTQEFPDTKDHQRHSAEIKIDALPVGQYALIATTNADFLLTKDPLAVHFLHVSALAWIRKSNDYFVLDRETGQPINGANVQIWYSTYDYNTRKNKKVKGESLSTDQNGFFSMMSTRPNLQQNIQLEISKGSDRLSTDDAIYYYRQSDRVPEVKDKKTSYLFLDRSIYRPGQTLYFKGIVVNRNTRTKNAAVAAGFKTTILLFDANQQIADSLEVTTNEFGSYSGKFILPVSVLNGGFRVFDKATQGSANLSVEEYKRPRFETKLESPKGSYKLNDTIKVTGSATAYAGNALNNAVVKYRVVRRAIFPVWGFSDFAITRNAGSRKMIWPPYPQNEVEIANGQVTTGTDGKFEIIFKAIPDAGIDRKNQPVFNYWITADITDISGETRSASALVAVAYHSLKLDLDLADKLHADSLNNIRLTSTNLNNVFQQAAVSVKLVKLKMPARIFRERLWEQADQHIMDEKTYIALFPHDIYKNENDPSAWEEAGTALTATDSTKENGAFKLPSQKIEAGWYRFEAKAKDRSGDTVSVIRYLQLYREKIITPNLSASVLTDKSVVREGEKFQYAVETNVDSLFVIKDIESGNDSIKRSYISLNKNREARELTVTSSESGGFGISIAFVKYNRIFTSFERIEVLQPGKELTISYETFRDKTIPGSSEKWKLKISGHKADKLAAEVLTGMYDASLDQFNPHAFNKPDIWPSYFQRSSWEGPTFRMEYSRMKPQDKQYLVVNKTYDRLFFDDQAADGVMYVGAPGRLPGGGGIKIRGNMARQENLAPAAISVQEKRGPEMNQSDAGLMESDTSSGPDDSGNPAPSISMRKNFNETAFFFPDLKTDSSGNIEFSFTIPEALTRWKWMTLAHTKDLAFGLSEKSIVTQKELMVQPNATRFVRQGDKIDFSAKIVNLTDSEMTGQVELLLIDPSNNRSVDGWFKNVFPNQFFTAPAKESIAVNFSIEIPFQYSKSLTYRVVARSGNMSDGEEGILPVLSNRILITESLQLPVRGSASKSFTFDKLLKSEGSETITNHSLSVEYTSNPAWLAIQALPFLAGNTRESADETFNNFYAAALAAAIVNASPGIKDLFSKYKDTDTADLLSNLDKNPELKSILLAETPWVLQARSEREQRRRLATMFDVKQISENQLAGLAKLSALQSPEGAFSWFPGGPNDRYITQYILTGIGHLLKLNPQAAENISLQSIIKKGLAYVDGVIVADYERLVKTAKKPAPPTGGLDHFQVQYGYLRSFFRNYPMAGNTLKAFNYYRSQSQVQWLKQPRYMQAMIAIALHRTDDIKTANSILASLKQNAIVNDEFGMYWKDVRTGYYWHQAPIETQSVLVEAFAEIGRDEKAGSDMKTWLLKQKQTQGWSTTRATADACYALLLPIEGKPATGITNLLTNTPEVEIRLGSTVVSSSAETAESGSGYFKKTFTEEQVKPSMGNIQVTIRPSNLQPGKTSNKQLPASSTNTSGRSNDAVTKTKDLPKNSTNDPANKIKDLAKGSTNDPASKTKDLQKSSTNDPANKTKDLRAGNTELPTWGAVYWQYFENLDQVTSANGSLQINKKLFVQNNTANGPVLTPYTNSGPLKIGDKVKIRLELKCDRDMEYVHLKDMRAAGMEPVNVLSSYKWQGGLGYYESTSDAATNFYFSRINKGTYVFEYVVFVTHTGTFNNGIATFQSIYAPEFKAHSEGITVSVE